MILNGCHLMFAISIMSLSKEGEACTASVREGETAAQGTLVEIEQELVAIRIEGLLWTCLNAHLGQKFNKLLLKNKILGVGIDYAKLVDGAQMRFGSLHFLLLFEQLPQNKLRHLPKIKTNHPLHTNNEAYHPPKAASQHRGRRNPTLSEQ